VADISFRHLRHRAACSPRKRASRRRWWLCHFRFAGISGHVNCTVAHAGP
jgi:hypothetical protein